MCWGCGSPQTLGPGAQELGGWAPGSAFRPRPRAGPAEGGKAREEAPLTPPRLRGSAHLTGALQRKQAGGATEHSPTVPPRFRKGKKPFPQEGCEKVGVGGGLPIQSSSRTGLYLTPCRSLLPSSAVPFSPSAMLTMGVLGSPSSCRGGHRKGSEEPLAALALGKVQFLASWTGAGGPGSSQGSIRGQGEGGWWVELPERPTPLPRHSPWGQV